MLLNCDAWCDMLYLSYRYNYHLFYDYLQFKIHLEVIFSVNGVVPDAHRRLIYRVSSTQVVWSLCVLQLVRICVVHGNIITYFWLLPGVYL